MSPKYDLLLKGATVVDPVNRREEVVDLAVAGGRVVTTEAGATYVLANGLEPLVVDLAASAFYHLN